MSYPITKNRYTTCLLCAPLSVWITQLTPHLIHSYITVGKQLPAMCGAMPEWDRVYLLQNGSEARPAKSVRNVSIVVTIECLSIAVWVSLTHTHILHRAHGEH